MPSTKTVFAPTLNQRPQDIVNQSINGLQLVPVRGQLVDTKKANNTFNLPSSTFPFYKTSSDDTSISGNNSEMEGLEANHRLKVSGVRFTDTVTLKSQAVAMFTNCYFTKQVVVESGGRATFSDCVFAENVNNAGAVGNVGILGCTRLGAMHINVTIIFEV